VVVAVVRMRPCRLRATANLLDPSAGHFGEKSRTQETFPALACESHLKTIVLDQDDQDPLCFLAGSLPKKRRRQTLRQINGRRLKLA
jgi:hypothetical protein